MTDQPTEPPDFRDWADDPENAEALDRLIAAFVLDDGVEMVGDLIGCRGQQHQWCAERWIDALRQRFERWWADGRPTIRADGKLVISYFTPTLERDAQSLLEATLPPAAVFGLTRRWRKLAGGRSEPAGWSVRIEDGPATAAGQGDTPAAAARRAIEAWREFVAGDRVELPLAEPERPAGRPPLLDAPSAGDDDEDAAGESGREAV
jgi:hypothetical protein